MASGIVSWGTYLPYWRLQRSAIGDSLGAPGGRGTRSVAGYDEDTTTLGVEAGRRALAPPGTSRPDDLYFSTPDPAYLDKTNATALHAALGLATRCSAYDLGGAPRSAVAAMLMAEARGHSASALCVLSDIRTGLAGGAEERDSGDGASAYLFGPDGAVAALIGRGAASDEFLDRWRLPGQPDSHQWEERFGEQVYVPLAQAAFADALKDAGVTESGVDHLVVSGLHTRAVKVTIPTLGVRTESIPPDLTAAVGNLGAAQFGLALADVLERAAPNEVVVVLSMADGADALVLRTTEALIAHRAARREAGVPTVVEQVAGGRRDLAYTAFLSWRGQLKKEPPRRPDPDRPGAPVVHRSQGWKYGFNASCCLVCGFRHLPPTRVCLQCRSVDQMESERLAEVKGTVATFTIDRLAFSLSPPVVGVVVDFDGGGRYRCEMTDMDVGELKIGTRVAMTFRRIYTAQGVHNYFWKARPIGDDGQPAENPVQGAKTEEER